MTPEQALNIFEQLRLQTNATGELHDQVREALNVLRALAVKQSMSTKPKE